MIRYNYLSHAFNRKAYNKWYYENFTKKNRLKGRGSSNKVKEAVSEKPVSSPISDMFGTFGPAVKKDMARQFVKGKIFSYITPKPNKNPTLTYGTTKKRRRNWRASLSMHMVHKVADIAWKKNEKKINRLIDKYIGDRI